MPRGYLQNAPNDEGSTSHGQNGAPSKTTTPLVAIVESDPLSEVRHAFKRRTGIDVHEQTIVKTLRKLGIQRMPSEQAVCVERKPNARRYGYTK